VINSALRCLLGFRGTAIDTFLLLSPELPYFLFYGLVQPTLQLGTVSERKEGLKPDEEGCEEESLNQVVKQCWCPALKFAVPYKLRNPADNVYGARPGIRGRAVRGREVVSIGSPANDERRDHGPRYRLHEDIQCRV